MTEKCRICQISTCNLESISVLNKLNEENTILDSIVAISSVQILENDFLPQSICDQCYLKLYQLYLFRSLIITSDKELKEQLNKNFQEPHKIDLTDLKCIERKVEDDAEGDYLENNECAEHNDAESIVSNSEFKLEFEKDLLGTCDLNLHNLGHKVKTRTKTLKNISNACKIKKSKSGKKHECLECGQSFKKAHHLNVHFAYKHSEKQFECNICNKKFARKFDLVYHHRVHTGERPFTCELCGKSFATPSYFYMHKRTHTGDKRIKCNLCQSSFINSDQLKIHIRQKHTGERPYLCELCSQAFASSSGLFRHKRDVHDQKVQCPICNNLYSSRVLKDHLKRHKEREDGIKRFTCDVCGKKFTCATSRKRHLVIHSGEKEFKCEICEKAFNQRSTLQTHMRVHSQIMPFQCDICSKSFRYKHHLKLHCEKHHSNEHCLHNTLDIKAE